MSTQAQERKLTLFRNPARRMVEFYLAQIERPDSIYIGEPIEMRLDENRGLTTRPTFEMTFEDAQAFIDELWQSGFRPSGKGEQEIGAQAKHLEDMRRIAFMFLEKRNE